MEPFTGRVTQRFTLTNTGDIRIAGPVSLVFDNLTPEFSLAFYEGGGTTTCIAPTGASYHNSLSLGVGESQAADIKFVASAHGRIPPVVSYSVHLLTGGDVR